MQSGASAPAPLPNLGAAPTPDTSSTPPLMYTAPNTDGNALHRNDEIPAASSTLGQALTSHPAVVGALNKLGAGAQSVGSSLVSGHAAEDWANYSGNHGMSAVGALASVPDAVTNYARFQNKMQAGGFENGGDGAPGTDWNAAAREGVPATTDLVGALGAGGVSRAATTGAAGEVGIIGGRGALAKTPATKLEADMAESMIASGADQNDVLQHLGWFRGQDGMMKKEISDAGSSINPSALVPGFEGKLSDVLNHPEGYAAYPHLADTPFTTKMPRGSEDNLGAQDPATGMIYANVLHPQFTDPHGTLLHEMQHGVQDAEGFAQGAAPEDFHNSLPLGARDPFDAYWRSSGEVEARNVDARKNLTSEQVRIIPPWATEDYHPDYQFVPDTHEQPGYTNASAPARGALAAAAPDTSGNNAKATVLSGGVPTAAPPSDDTGKSPYGALRPLTIRPDPKPTTALPIFSQKKSNPVGALQETFGQLRNDPAPAPAAKATPALAPQSDAAELAAIKRGDTGAVLKAQAAQNTPGQAPAKPAPAAAGANSEDAAMFGGLETKYGLPTGYLGKVGAIESSNGKNLSTPLSSAKGYFQFTNATAKQYGVDVNSTASSADGAARLAVANRNALAKGLGVSPDQITGAQLYLAHQQGSAGALKILRNPNASMESLVGEKAAKANGGAGLTGGQFFAKWGSTFDRAVMGKGRGLPGTDAPLNQGPGSGGAKGALAPQKAPAPAPIPIPGKPGQDGEDGYSKGAMAALGGGGSRGRTAAVQFGPPEKEHEADLSLAALIKRRGKVVKGALGYGHS